MSETKTYSGLDGLDVDALEVETFDGKSYG